MENKENEWMNEWMNIDKFANGWCKFDLVLVLMLCISEFSLK